MDPFDICINLLGFSSRQYIDIIIYYFKYGGGGGSRTQSLPITTGLHTFPGKNREIPTCIKQPPHSLTAI